MKMPAIKDAAFYWKWLQSSAVPALYQTRFGGSSDAMALATLAAGAVASSPMAALLGGGLLAPSALGGLGGGLLASRFMSEMSAPTQLASELGITSALAPDLRGGQGLLVGYTSDGGVPIRIPFEALTRHFLTGGMTGVGKTVSAITFMVQQIAMGGGVLWVDGKLDPDNILTLFHIAKWLGREVDFRVINPGDPGASNTYNFLLEGDPDEVASRILSTIPSTEGNAGADYYKQAANQGLTILVSAIQAAGYAYNAMDLSILLTNEKAMTNLEKLVMERAANHPAVGGFQLFLEQYKTRDHKTGEIVLDMKKIKDTFGGVAGRLFVYGSDKMGKVTSAYNPDVRLFDEIKNNRIVYCALPTMGKQLAAQNFGKIVLGDARSAIARIQSLPKNERPWPPFLLWMDELPSYGSAAALETPFQQARSAHVYLGVGYQENSSIEALGESFLGTIAGNTFSKIFFKPANRETADCWADLIGKHKALSTSFSQTFGGGASAANLRVTPDSQRSNSVGIAMQTKEQEEYRLSAEKLAKLDFGQAVLLYGASKIYDIRVPKLDFSPLMRSELGGLSIQRPRKAFNKVEGLDLFNRYSDFITKLADSAEVKAARAAEGKPQRTMGVK